jgi:hypothetical protein
MWQRQECARYGVAAWLLKLYGIRHGRVTHRSGFRLYGHAVLVAKDADVVRRVARDDVG